MCVCVCVSPVKPQASASRKVLHDMRKNKAVSSSWKSLSLVNLVTYRQTVKEFNKTLTAFHVELLTSFSHDINEKIRFLKILFSMLLHVAGIDPIYI